MGEVVGHGRARLQDGRGGEKGGREVVVDDDGQQQVVMDVLQDCFLSGKGEETVTLQIPFSQIFVHHSHKQRTTLQISIITPSRYIYPPWLLLCNVSSGRQNHWYTIR